MKSIRASAGVKKKILLDNGWKCACCGVHYPWVIAYDLDHVNSDGYITRNTLGVRSGIAAWKDWRKRGYPPTAQILCIQCNQMKARNKGVCPHQEDEL